jgi:hypothetical protein
MFSALKPYVTRGMQPTMAELLLSMTRLCALLVREQ